MEFDFSALLTAVCIHIFNFNNVRHILNNFDNRVHLPIINQVNDFRIKKIHQLLIGIHFCFEFWIFCVEFVEMESQSLENCPRIWFISLNSFRHSHRFLNSDHIWILRGNDSGIFALQNIKNFLIDLNSLSRISSLQLADLANVNGGGCIELSHHLHVLCILPCPLLTSQIFSPNEWNFWQIQNFSLYSFLVIGAVLLWFLESLDQLVLTFDFLLEVGNHSVQSCNFCLGLLISSQQILNPLFELNHSCFVLMQKLMVIHLSHSISDTWLRYVDVFS